MRASVWFVVTSFALVACTSILGNDFEVSDDPAAGGDGGADPSSGGTAGSVANGGDGGTSDGGMGGDGGGAESCDPLQQNCSNGTDKCVPLASGDAICIENGTLTEGATCNNAHPGSGVDGCALGLICHLGQCTRICIGGPTSHNCGNVADCTQPAGNTYQVCEPWCDPLDATGCMASFGCYWQGDGFRCATAGSIGTTSPCLFDEDCTPGHACVPNLAGCNGTACCAQWCDKGVSGQCAPLACLNHPDAFPPELANVGFCWSAT